MPPHEDEVKVYRMFFLRVNSSALVGLTDCIDKNKRKSVSTKEIRGKEGSAAKLSEPVSSVEDEY